MVLAAPGSQGREIWFHCDRAGKSVTEQGGRSRATPQGPARPWRTRSGDGFGELDRGAPELAGAVVDGEDRARYDVDLDLGETCGRLAACDQLGGAGGLEVGALDPVAVGLGPVDLGAGDVEGDALGAVDAGVGDHLDRSAAVEVGAHDAVVGVLGPVRLAGADVDGEAHRVGDAGDHVLDVAAVEGRAADTGAGAGRAPLDPVHAAVGQVEGDSARRLDRIAVGGDVGEQDLDVAGAVEVGADDAVVRAGVVDRDVAHDPVELAGVVVHRQAPGVHGRADRDRGRRRGGAVDTGDGVAVELGVVKVLGGQGVGQGEQGGGEKDGHEMPRAEADGRPGACWVVGHRDTSARG